MQAGVQPSCYQPTMKIEISGAGAEAARAEIVRAFRERRGIECIRAEAPGVLQLYCLSELDLGPLIARLKALYPALELRISPDS